MQWNERIGRRLKLRDLHILLAVAQRGSMARAASELAMSQPAVSKAIADMERELGIRLLDRTPRGIEPTMYGRALIKRGLAIFDELRQGVHELGFLADPSVGELRIGSSEGMAAGLLPAIVDRILKSHPRIVFNVTQAVFASTHYRDLRERSVDLLLGRVFSPFDEEDLAVEALFEDKVVVVAAKGSPLARRRQLSLTDLHQERWVLHPPDTPAGHLAAELFHTAGLKMPHAPVLTLSIHLGLKLAATGQFVALLPSSVLRFAGKESAVTVLPIRLPVQSRTVGIITLKNRTLSPVAELFIKYAREMVPRGASKKTNLS
jgi:DNA-binding transcriptional LysR family regulator